MFWFLHKFKFRRFSCIRKPNVKLKMYDAKTCILFLKKVHLSCMGTYFNNNILLRKTLQVFIVWQKSMAKQYIAECAENLEDTVVPVMVTSWWQFMTSYLIFRYSDIHHISSHLIAGFPHPLIEFTVFYIKQFLFSLKLKTNQKG